MEKVVEKIERKLPLVIKKKRVAAYARVSTGKESMLHSLSDQIRYYTSLIQKQSDWEFAGVYYDEALTGTKSDREGFLKMLKACREGKIDMIMVKSISRFARNTVTLLETVRELKALNIDVYFEEHNIYTLSSEGELMLTLLASFAQAESLSASENQKWRIKRAFEKGDPITLRFMLGYDISREGIKINEEEAEIVREIYNDVLLGKSFTSIAKDLNDRGIKGKFGCPWTTRTIMRILKNEKYTGNMLLYKRYRNNHIDKQLVDNNGDKPMYYVESSHDAIIDKQVFDKVQEIIKNREQNLAPKHYSCFTGRIRCKKCGANYKRRKQGDFYYWNCSTYITKGKNNCPGCRIREEMLYNLAPDDFEQIEINDNVIMFELVDGNKISKEWQPKSRSESWNDDMKMKAKERSERYWKER